MGNTAGLHIKNSAPFVRFQDDSGTTADIEIYAFNGALYIYDNEDSAERMSIDTTGNVVFNQSGADSDFRVESDGNANMLFVDGGGDSVNIGTTTNTYNAALVVKQ